MRPRERISTIAVVVIAIRNMLVRESGVRGFDLIARSRRWRRDRRYDRL